MVCRLCHFAINTRVEHDFALDVGVPGGLLAWGVSGPDSLGHFSHSNTWQCLAAAVLHRGAKSDAQEISE